MRRIVTPGGIFDTTNVGDFDSFREAIRSNAELLFGSDRYYLECGRSNDGNGVTANIPLYYLLDLAGKEPKLFVIYFDLFNIRYGNFDIGNGLRLDAQKFHSSQAEVSKSLLEVINRDDQIRDACCQYTTEWGHTDLRSLVNYLVNECDFNGLAIIDYPTDARLSDVNSQQFPVEVLEFTILEDAGKQKSYSFTPFFPTIGPSTLDIGDVDTVVTPVPQEGFEQTYLKENCWWAIRLNNSLISQLKHHVAYRTAPISAITHTAPISKIYHFPRGDRRKYRIDFKMSPISIRAIGLGSKGENSALSSPAYTSMDMLRNANTLEDVPLILGLGPMGSG